MNSPSQLTSSSAFNSIADNMDDDSTATPNLPYNELKWRSAPLDADHHQVCPTPSSRKEASPLPLHAEKTALLVVDVQPEYWSQCPAVRQDFPDFPSRLQATVDICRRQTLAKIIWMRADYRYSHSPWLKQFSRIHGLEHATAGVEHQQFRGEVICDPTSKEFSWEDFVTPIGGEVILPKTSWSSTSNTALMDILRCAQVDTVLVCGLITSVCVQHSAFGIFEAGYRTILVTDACADRGRARHEAALALYGGYMYDTLTSHDLLSGLEKAKPLWVLPAKDDDKKKHAYSPITTSTLATAGSASSLSSSSASSYSNGDNEMISATPPLQI